MRWRGLALAVALPYFAQPDMTPYWPTDPSATQRSPAQVAHFEAIDQDGAAITDQNFSGRITLVNFFFSTCGSTCPKMMSALSRLQKTLKTAGLASQIAIYSFSVTPEEDSPAKLRHYISARHLDMSNWKLVTGKREEIYRVGKGMFKADRSVGAQKSETSFIHSENVYLVDRERRIRGIYDSGSASEMATLAGDIQRLYE